MKIVFHIAIEGFDGVGKTTICKLLAEKLNFRFVEKPLHYLFDSENDFTNYIRIRDYVNSQDNKVFTSWFYGLGNIYLYHYFQNENIITDRHFVSNYYWSGDKSSKTVFDCMINLIGKPDYTFLLHADENIIKKRLVQRNELDPDLLKTPLIPKAYHKMENFLIEYGMKYKLINTSGFSVNEVVDEILKSLAESKLI